MYEKSVWVKLYSYHMLKNNVNNNGKLFLKKVCVCQRCVCECVNYTQHASMCPQQVSFPDSPVRHWFLF